MSTIKEYIKENEPRFVEEWFSLLRIPSVSSQTEHKADMGRCAERWRELLLSSGADRAEVMPTGGNPVVYAERIVSPDLPTVLVYGHYDVMPAEPLELWQSEPFEPTIRDGRVYARGADDDKGQAMIQAKGFETALRAGAVHCNVKFILEGEEEVGSESLIAFCKTHGELLRADVILVSDTSMVSAETPSLTTGLRGLSYWEIEVTGPNRDLHSGHFGGAVANPINALCKLIASLTDADGRITLPHFYDDVEELSADEKAMIARVPFDEQAYKRAIDVHQLPADVRRLRHLGRLHGRGLEDGPAVQGLRQAVVPPRAASGSGAHHAHDDRLPASGCPDGRPGEGRLQAQRRAVCLPHRSAGLQGRRGWFHDRLRQAALGRAPWRQHPRHPRV